MAGFRTALIGQAALALCLGCAVSAKDAKSSAQKQLSGAAYIEQIGAPGNWQGNAAFWTTAAVIPPDLDRGSTLKLAVSDAGNTVQQVQSGPAQREFVLQWGRRNSASQTVTGAANRAEVVQISPGALVSGKANAGAGNGPEIDLFGFEIDPGNAGTHNHSPEAGGGAGPAPGLGNTAVQVSAGAQNVERVVQIGWANFAQEKQQGSGDQSVVVQLGSDQRADSDQRGSHDSSLIVQQGAGNSASVVQE